MGAELIKLCHDLATKLLAPREPKDEKKGLSKRRVFQGRDLERTAEGEASVKAGLKDTMKERKPPQGL